MRLAHDGRGSNRARSHLVSARIRSAQCAFRGQRRHHLLAGRALASASTPALNRASGGGYARLRSLAANRIQSNLIDSPKTIALVVRAPCGRRALAGRVTGQCVTNRADGGDGHCDRHCSSVGPEFGRSLDID